MNDHEKDRIAAALNQLRPDWPTRSIRTLLDRPQLADRPRRDVVVALGWVACEPSSATPARVLEAGPWWRAAASGADTVRLEHLKPEDRCKTCSKSEPDCRLNPWGDHEFEPDVHRPRDVDLAPVVAELKGHTQPAKEETA
jgi:hypothetical protein